MSTVRMCDKCGRVFSELESGWQTINGSTFEEDEHGILRERATRMDACSDCAVNPRKLAKQQAEQRRALEAEGYKAEAEPEPSSS